MVLYLYSTEIKKILGKAEILSVEELDIDKMVEKYQTRLFLNEFEIAEYKSFGQNKWREKSRSKKVLVLVLKNIKKYNIPQNFSKRVNVSGFYMKI